MENNSGQRGKAPYIAFGKCKMVPLKVYLNSREIESDTWDEDLWVERGEDLYALGSTEFRNKRIRVIERSAWLVAEECG